MSPYTTPRPVMSTPLRVFIGISIILHIVAVGVIVVPSVLGLFRQSETAPTEEEILLMKQREAEQIQHEAALQEVKKELAAALKEDMRRLAGDMPPPVFEAAWSNSMSVIASNLNLAASQLAQENLADLAPRDLAETLRSLREAELDVLMRQLESQSKDEIAARVLNEVGASLPQFVGKALSLMEQAESPKLQTEVDKLLASEQQRRQRELSAANTALADAQRQVDQAAVQSAAIGKSLAGLLGDNDKRAEAALKADESLQKALQAADQARRQADALETALAAKAGVDRTDENGAALQAEAAKAQAESDKALAGAKAALQDAAAQAAKAGLPESRSLEQAGAKAAEAARASGESAQALKSKDPSTASQEMEKAAAGAVAAASAAADVMKPLQAAAGSTNGATARPAGAALKSAGTATNLLATAVDKARAAADLTRRADEARRASLMAAAEPARALAARAVETAEAAVAQAANKAATEAAGETSRRMRETAKAYSQVLNPALAGLDRSIRSANISEAAAQADKVASELQAAAGQLGKDADALAQEASARKAPALAEQGEALRDAARQLGDARSRVQRMAEAMRGAPPAAGAKPETAESMARAAVAEARDGLRNALDSAGRDLKNSAATMKDKSQKPVADVLTQAAASADAIGTGPVKQVADLADRNPGQARAGVPAVKSAISNLTEQLSKGRGQLDALAGRPTADESAAVQAARARIGEAGKSLGGAVQQLDKAAQAADKGSDTDASRSIETAARTARETGAGVIAHAADSLSAKPADPAIPDAGPRPGRKEMSMARQDMDTATNRLGELSRSITEQKTFLGRSAARFESNFVQTVDATLTQDPTLRDRTRELVRQTLRDQVAGEFREKTEALAESVLAKKGMASDPAFVRSVGRQAADMLLAGTETNLLNASFASMLSSTAKRYGITPEELRAAAKCEDDTAESAEAPEGPEGQSRQPMGPHTCDGKKRRRPSAPAGMASGEPNSAANANGMEAVSDALEASLGKSLRTGAQGAIAQSAGSMLRLPGINSFGETGTDTLRGRLAEARGGGLRSLSAGGRETFVAGVSENLVEVGMKLRNGAIHGRRSGLYNNPEEYRRNLETVIKGREIKEVVLVAPSLTNAVSTAASEISSNRPSLILVGSGRSRRQAETNAAAAPPTGLAPPEFKAFAYGGAPFATNPPAIDGDLSDWDAVKPFALRGILEKNWVKDIPPQWETNRYLMAQWDYTGFYFAYRMVDNEDDTNIGAENFWEGDSLELWFDFSNRRSDNRAEDQQQLWFWPLGSRRLPGVIGGEVIMPGGRAEPRFKASSTSPGDPRIAVKRTTSPRGYQVEVFVPLACFRRPDLTPGRIMAFNFSINNGNHAYLLWTTNLGKQNSMTPSVWGDLVLLGSDAQIAAIKPRRKDEALAAIIPGEPLGVRVTDPDMNLDPRVRNQLKVRFLGREGQGLVGYLQETDVSTGIFEGSLDTVEILPGEDRETTNNALPVVSGSYVAIEYFDQARRFGERNYTLRKQVPVGVPVMRMSSRK